MSLLIEAFADAETNELLTIAAWPDGLRQRKRVPLAELRLIARNKPVDEAKFIVAKSLSNDGRIGRVADSQGIVVLRPVMRSRWTPISRQMLIRPGDWLRTDVRGANAASIVMTSQFRVIAGPGSQVEIQKPGQILLHGGEVQISGSENAEEDLTLLTPRDQKVVVKAGETGLYRLLADRTLRKIEKKPIWLAGFEGSSNEESIGSLICNIDGRNVPLTVGYHKVSVEIRDQIARTTIEESFVNRTLSWLEGVFHFRFHRTRRSAALACGLAANWLKPTLWRNSVLARFTKRSCPNVAIPDSWNGPAEIFLKLECSRSRAAPKSGSKLSTRRCCRCGRISIDIRMRCAASCCRRLRCGSCR